MSDSTMRPNEALYLNLKLLGFEVYLNNNANITKSVVFNGSMFDTKNTRAFQCVTHFLLCCCGRAFNADRILASMKPCYPCLENSQEVDFRKLVAEFFTYVEKDRDFVTTSTMPIHKVIQDAGGNRFIQMYLKLTSLIFIRKLDSEQRSSIRGITSATPKSAVNVIVKQNLDEMEKIKEVMSESKETFFLANQPIIDSLEEAKTSRSEWQEAVSNSCATLLRSLGRSDVKPLPVNVRSEVSTQEQELKKKIIVANKYLSEISTVTKSLKSVGTKLQEINFCEGEDPISLLEKASKVQKSLEQQLLPVPGKVIEDKKKQCVMLCDQFHKSSLELQNLRTKLTEALKDGRFEHLRKQVLEIPNFKERYETFRRQFIPSRNPVLKFGAIRSKKLPRGWWMADTSTDNNINGSSNYISNRTNGYTAESPPPSMHRDSMISNVSMDMSFNFQDMSHLEISHLNVHNVTSPPLTGITDQSSFQLTDLE